MREITELKLIHTTPIPARPAKPPARSAAQPSASPPMHGMTGLSISLVAILWFIHSNAAAYLTLDPGRYGIYWPRHQWLIAHMAGGTAALLLGPLQFWLVSNHRRMLHIVMGIAYVLSVGTGATAAFYLAAHTDFSWMFGLGFGCMAGVWVITTAFAVVAICRRNFEQHREWMIRSYVVTCGFVVFRLTVQVMGIAQIGTVPDQLTAASWFCWAVPLFLTEMILQGRKIFATARPLGN